MTINQSRNREITAPGSGVEQPQPETSGALATEHQAPLPADCLSPASTTPAPGAKTGPHALVEKYEIGSGKNKINVRIFREPPAEPDIPEPGKEAPIRQGDENTQTPILRLKKDFLTVPSRPKQIKILEEE